MAPWIFVAGRKKEGALSERSEFGSFPSPRHKSKEGVAISGAPFFCLLFFGKTKKSKSVPAGNERGMDHQVQNTHKKTLPMPPRRQPHPTHQQNRSRHFKPMRPSCLIDKPIQKRKHRLKHNQLSRQRQRQLAAGRIPQAVPQHGRPQRHAYIHQPEHPPRRRGLRRSRRHTGQQKRRHGQCQ